MAMRFRVLRGNHVTGSRKKGTYHKFTKGDVVDSTVDLVKRFGGVKFERLPDGPDMAAVTEAARTGFSGADYESATAVAKKDDGAYGDMTIEELRLLAEEEEIDLGGAKSKAAIIAALRAARG